MTYQKVQDDALAVVLSFEREELTKNQALCRLRLMKAYYIGENEHILDSAIREVEMTQER